MSATLTGSAVPTRKPRISFVISEELKAKLEKIAEKQRRTVSNVLAIMVEDYVAAAEQRGDLQRGDLLDEPTP